MPPVIKASLAFVVRAWAYPLLWAIRVRGKDRGGIHREVG